MPTPTTLMAVRVPSTLVRPQPLSLRSWISLATLLLLASCCTRGANATIVLETSLKDIDLDKLTINDIDTAGALEGAGAVPRCDTRNDTNCWTFMPLAEDRRKGCLGSMRMSEYFTRRAKGRDGRWATIVLEENGWDSQSLANARISVILQERMGYLVVLRRSLDYSGAYGRVQSGQSHLVMEFWAQRHGIEFGSPHTRCASDDDEKCAVMHLTGYRGGTGLFSNARAFDFTKTGLDRFGGADYYQTYRNATITQNFRPAKLMNASNPFGWDFTIQGSYRCVEEWCNGSNFRTSECSKDPSKCAVMYATSPTDNALLPHLANLENHKLMVETVFEDHNLQDKVMDNIDKEPFIFYTWYPSQFHSRLHSMPRSAESWERISFPQRTAVCKANFDKSSGTGNPTQMEGVTCELGSTPLVIVAHSPKVGSVAHNLLDRALRSIGFVGAVDDKYIESLIARHYNISHSKDVRSKNKDKIDRYAACQEVVNRPDDWVTVIDPVPLEDLLTTSEIATGIVMMVIGLACFIITVLQPPPYMVGLVRLWKRLSRYVVPALNVTGASFLLGGFDQFELDNRRGGEVGHKVLTAFLVTVCCMAANVYVRDGVRLAQAVFKPKSSEDMQSGTGSSYALPIISISVSLMITFGWIIGIAFAAGASKELIVGTFSGLILVVTFALKDIIANFVNSIIFLLEHPYSIGDWVKAGGVEGLVEEIGLTFTRLRGFDQKLYMVPTKNIVGGTVVNTFRAPALRVDCTFTVAFGCPPETLAEFITTLRHEVLKIEHIQDIVSVGVKSFESSGYEIGCYLLTSHAPASDAYKGEHAWAWWDQYNETKTKVSVFIGSLLEEFGLDLGGKKMHLTTAGHNTLRVRHTLANDPDPAEVIRQAAQLRIEQRFNNSVLSPEAAEDLRGAYVYACTVDDLDECPTDETMSSWLEDSQGFCDGRGPPIIALCFTRCEYIVTSHPAKMKQAFISKLAALKKRGGDDTHCDLTATIATTLEGRYTLLAESRNSDTSLIVLCRCDVAISCSVVARSDKEEIPNVHGACAVVIKCGGHSISIIGVAVKAMSTNIEKGVVVHEPTKEERVAHTETALRWTVEALSLQPATMGGADVLHVADASVCLGALPLYSPNYRDYEKIDPLLDSMNAGRCLYGFVRAASSGPACVLHDSRRDKVENFMPMPTLPKEFTRTTNVARSIVRLSADLPKIATSGRNGQFWLHFESLSCEGLVAVNSNYPGGPIVTADPYVRLSSACFAALDGQKGMDGPGHSEIMRQVPTKRRTLTPEWRKAELKPIPTVFSDVSHLKTHSITLAVFDAEFIGQDDPLGFAIVSLANIKLDEPFDFDEDLLIGGTPHGRIRGTLSVNLGPQSVAKRRFKAAVITATAATAKVRGVLKLKGLAGGVTFVAGANAGLRKKASTEDNISLPWDTEQ